MLDYVVYGKIIIDDISLPGGRIERSLLGGGGPQAAFGAALWSDSVGLLSRSGTDIAEEHARVLTGLGIDLDGWRRFPGIPTTHGMMQYDENEYLVGAGVTTGHADWMRLLAQPLDLPPAYRRPRAMHLITEFHDEPMVEDARALRARGTLFSLEPIIDYHAWTNRDGIVALLRQVDLVTPDWPSAAGIAGSDAPREVLRRWSALGPALIAVRHGRHGSYIWDRERDQAWHVAALPVRVVDPTGAGNAYGGALCVGWTETGDARTAAAYAAIAAAFLVRRYSLPPVTPELRDEAHGLLDEALSAMHRLF